jgi:hypothetical protein
LPLPSINTHAKKNRQIIKNQTYGQVKKVTHVTIISNTTIVIRMNGMSAMPPPGFSSSDINDDMMAVMALCFVCFGFVAMRLSLLRRRWSSVLGSVTLSNVQVVASFKQSPQKYYGAHQGHTKKVHAYNRPMTNHTPLHAINSSTIMLRPSRKIHQLQSTLWSISKRTATLRQCYDHLFSHQFIWPLLWPMTSLRSLCGHLWYIQPIYSQKGVRIIVQSSRCERREFIMSSK